MVKRYNKRMDYRLNIMTLYSGAGKFDLSNKSVVHAASPCAGIEGFLVIAHLCTVSRKYVGALFLFTGLSSNGKDTIKNRDLGSIPGSPFFLCRSCSAILRH